MLSGSTGGNIDGGSVDPQRPLVAESQSPWGLSCSGTKSYPPLWDPDPVNCSTPGLPVLHYILELAQTHVSWVSDAIHHLVLCCPLLLPSIFPSIRVFSNESLLRIRWPKYWSFSFSIGPSNEYSGWFPLGLTGWISLLFKGFSRVFST